MKSVLLYLYVGILNLGWMIALIGAGASGHPISLMNTGNGLFLGAILIFLTGSLCLLLLKHRGNKSLKIATLTLQIATAGIFLYLFYWLILYGNIVPDIPIICILFFLLYCCIKSIWLILEAGRL
jgi:hypothetical protein